MFARSRSNTIIVLKLAGIVRFEGPARAVATQIDACNAAQQARSQAAIPCAACDGQSEGRPVGILSTWVGILSTWWHVVESSPGSVMLNIRVV